MNYVIILIISLLILYILDFKSIKNNINKLFGIENTKLVDINEYNKNYQMIVDRHNDLFSSLRLPKTNNIMYELNTQSITMIKNDIRQFFSKNNYYIEFIKNTNDNISNKYTVVNNDFKDILYIPSFIILINIYYMVDNDKIKINKKKLSLSILIDPDNNNFNIIHIETLDNLKSNINNFQLYNDTIIDTIDNSIPIIDTDVIDSIINENIDLISNDNTPVEDISSTVDDTEKSIFLKPPNEIITTTKFQDNNNSDDSLIPDVINISESDNINVL